MTNYIALGEYTAYSEQARNAAGRRFAYMKNLACQLNRMAEQPDTVVQEEALRSAVADIIASDKEMRAALEKANASAPLCGKPDITLNSLSRF
ncbi:UNVERIFIED_ORG: hypothetical protein FHU00_3958 [Citrobacter freundii]|uniref:hypothetical protein n=1 Tax=Citrobacter portucalensis TaxID=1639133 RepID=UPI00114FCF72|nr:hypothetical protein [Citrobacter portucalensis]NUH53994.1 hypothetical protein [Citrobacter portucalensis]